MISSIVYGVIVVAAILFASWLASSYLGTRSDIVAPEVPPLLRSDFLENIEAGFRSQPLICDEVGALREARKILIELGASLAHERIGLRGRRTKAAKSIELQYAATCARLHVQLGHILSARHYALEAGKQAVKL